eukprot:GEMP01090404.1.p1 GENE.GEMP01090404.1~~GEMP01090404.1.p1  ORF type:complete len:153 (+),score=21.44 GEMP01090404.1:81-539(+)
MAYAFSSHKRCATLSSSSAPCPVEPSPKRYLSAGHHGVLMSNNNPNYLSATHHSVLMSNDNPNSCVIDLAQHRPLNAHRTRQVAPNDCYMLGPISMETDATIAHPMAHRFDGRSAMEFAMLGSRLANTVAIYPAEPNGHSTSLAWCRRRLDF